MSLETSHLNSHFLRYLQTYSLAEPSADSAITSGALYSLKLTCLLLQWLREAEVRSLLVLQSLEAGGGGLAWQLGTPRARPPCALPLCHAAYKSHFPGDNGHSHAIHRSCIPGAGKEDGYGERHTLRTRTLALAPKPHRPA